MVSVENPNKKKSGKAGWRLIVNVRSVIVGHDRQKFTDFPPRLQQVSLRSSAWMKAFLRIRGRGGEPGYGTGVCRQVALSKPTGRRGNKTTFLTRGSPLVHSGQTRATALQNNVIFQMALMLVEPVASWVACVY